MAFITIPIKSTGQQVTAEEFNQILDALEFANLDINVGAVYVQDDPLALNHLNGVSITSVTSGQALVFNGTEWVNQDIATQSELNTISTNLNNHTSDSSIHFTQNDINIDHTQISDWSSQFTSDFNTNFGLKDTDDLAEGTTNKYDKTVTFSGGNNVTISGTYPNFTINDDSASSSHTHLLDNLTDVAINFGSLANGQGLVYDGSEWTNMDIATQSELDGVSGTLNTHVGDSSIHFTQAEISISTSQINDFNTSDITVNSLTSNTTIVYDSEYAASSSLNWNNGNKQSITLTTDTTLTFTNPSGATNLVLKVVQDSVGGHSITFPSSVKWEGGNAPDTSSDSGNAIRIFTFYFDGTNYFGQFTDTY